MKKGEIVYYHFLLTEGWYDDDKIKEVKKYDTSNGGHEIM